MKSNILPNSDITKPLKEKYGYLIPNTELGLRVIDELKADYPYLIAVDSGSYTELYAEGFKKEILN